VRYSGSAAKWLEIDRYRDTREIQAGYRETQAEYPKDTRKGRATATDPPYGRELHSALGLYTILP